MASHLRPSLRGPRYTPRASADIMPCAVRSRPPPPTWLSTQAAPCGVPPWAVQLADDTLPAEWPGTCGPHMVTVIGEGLMRIARRIDRDLDFVEFCSGWGEICYWCRQAGLNAHEYDAGTRHRDESLVSPLGLWWAGILVLRLRPQACAHWAPECSTWGFMNLGASKRHISVFGAEDRPDVQHANLTAEVISMLMHLCEVRRVYCSLEQPRNSQWARHPSAKLCLDMLQASRLFVYLGSFGHPTWKPTFLYCTWPDEQQAKLKRSRPAPIPANPEYHSIGNAGWVVGGKRLSETEHYPTGFCKSVAGIVYALSRMQRGLVQTDFF